MAVTIIVLLRLPDGTLPAKPKEQLAGDAASIVLNWSVEAVAKAGTISIVGVYGELDSFPIGDAMEKNLTLTMGNCNHRRYLPHLIELVRTGALDPAEILTQVEPMTSVIEAYKAFDQRRPGWIKVKLEGTKSMRRRRLTFYVVSGSAKSS